MTTPPIGSTVYARFEEIIVECTVCDHKKAYGRICLSLAPTRGQMTQWVDISRLVQLQSAENKGDL